MRPAEKVDVLAVEAVVQLSGERNFAISLLMRALLRTSPNHAAKIHRGHWALAGGTGAHLWSGVARVGLIDPEFPVDEEIFAPFRVKNS